MLMNMADVLSVANEHNFAVPAFNIGTGQILKAVIECCEEKKAPVILAIHPMNWHSRETHLSLSVLKPRTIPAFPWPFTLDHGGEYAQIERAIRDGFTSVMIDASHMSFEDNIAITKKVVAFAHPLGVSVEAELGTIGTTDGDTEGGTDDIIYTRSGRRKEVC